tara:strand:- start:642 stop:944 length:303 start_codon:yes stop_codon:yes gene_type:complete
MKKIAFIIIIILILATSFVKNSTKEIEDKIFVINENIRPLKSELSDTLLEYNFLSSPGRLTQYQNQYFEKDLMKIDIINIKEITENNNLMLISDLIKNEK